MNELLTVKNLKVHFPITGGVLNRQVATVHAVDGVSFTLNKGETLGLVGESGCGKSTLGRALVKLYNPTEGSIFYSAENESKDFSQIGRKEMRTLRRQIQMIFQDPYESLNPRHSVGYILEEPFIVHRIGNPAERKEKIARLLKTVGLNPDAAERFPHEFSGGQRQRIGIARAIALEPKLIVCDEPVSALDVSIQSQILNLIMELQNNMGLTFLFIAHDLAVVRHVSDRVAVMYLGKIVELTDAESIYKNALHPYTQALIRSIPHPDPRKRSPMEALKGDVPSPINPPSGCRFRTRCPLVQPICAEKEPVLEETKNKNHWVACHLVGEAKTKRENEDGKAGT